MTSRLLRGTRDRIETNIAEKDDRGGGKNAMRSVRGEWHEIFARVCVGYARRQDVEDDEDAHPSHHCEHMMMSYPFDSSY